MTTTIALPEGYKFDPKFKPNIETIDKVIKFLLKERRIERTKGHDHTHFNMEVWVGFISDNVPLNSVIKEEPPTMCGSAACLSGAAVILDRGYENVVTHGLVDTFDDDTSRFVQRPGWKVKNIDFDKEGARLFGIPQEGSNLLFAKHRWPDRFVFNGDGSQRSDIDAAINILRSIKRGDLIMAYATTTLYPNERRYRWIYKGQRVN